MGKFTHPEDFNKEIQIYLEKIGCSEMYIYSLRVCKYSSLGKSEQQYISKQTTKNNCELDGSEDVVKFHTMTSHHYKEGKNGIQCNKINLTSKLFGTTIFPAILLSNLHNLEMKKRKNIWRWKYSDDMTLLIITKGCVLSKYQFSKLCKSHSDYFQNSLIHRNMSSKAINSSVKEFSMKFSLSLETTLNDFILYLENKYCNNKSDKILSVGLFKSSNKYQLENAWEEISDSDLGIPYNIRKKISRFICDSFFHIKTEMKEGKASRMVEKRKIVELTEPISKKSGDYYFLIIPVTREPNRIQFRYAIVLVSEIPVDSHILDAIITIIRKYYDTFIEHEKSNLILNLQRRLYERNNNIFNGNSIQELIELTDETFKDIVYLTNAYSATFRMYDAESRCLVKVVDKSNKEAKLSEDGEQLMMINIDEYAKKSVNCRTFGLNKNELCAIYIREISKESYPDDEDIDPNKLTIMKSREDTLSELCVPFYYHGVIVGVMNFESPILHAFDDECVKDDTGAVKFIPIKYSPEKYIKLADGGFLNIIKSTLQHFFSLRQERSDITHLSRLAEPVSNIHELKNFTNFLEKESNINPFKKRILDELRASRNYTSTNNGKFNVKDFLMSIRNERINTYFENLGDMGVISRNNIEDGYLKKHLPIQIEGKDPLIIKRAQFEICLRMIYRNLLNNFIIHGVKEKDVLAVKYVLKTNTLIISQIFNKPFSSSNRSWFNIPQETDDEPNSGLFIVGVSVRQLGGYIFPRYDNNDRLKGFNIQIKLYNLYTGEGYEYEKS